MHKVNLLRLLKRLTAETGKCILYSTHDLDLALQLSDDIIVMIPDTVTQGTPKDLITNKVFDKLFNDDNILFDPDKKGFIVKD
ncbi:iron-dicitrate transporter ATP-binding subunit [compost metagenome]